MARILTPEQFRECPKGTVFAFGPKWSLEQGPCILDRIITPDAAGNWGFVVVNLLYPALTRSSGFLTEDGGKPVEIRFLGADPTIQVLSTEDLPMDVFMVFDLADWEAAQAAARFPDHGQSDAA